MQNEIDNFKFIFLNGKRINQIEIISFKDFNEITIGRSNQNTIKFDTEDKMVSREHAKITRSNSKDDYWTFYLEDLKSTNGTYLNDVKIHDRKAILPGDIISLGEDGPRIRFTIEPIPTYLAERTEIGINDEGTVIEENVNIRNYSFPRVSLIITLLVASIIVFGALYYSNIFTAKPKLEAVQTETQPSKQPIQDMIAQNKGSVVNIEVDWHLIDNAYNEELWHVYQYDSNKNAFLPLYLREGNNYKPVLLPKSKRPFGLPIREKGSGTGFVVDSNGYILSCIHVTSGWKTKYKLGSGILIDDSGMILKYINEADISWIPESTKNSRGENIKLDVVFNEESIRRPASQVGNSSEHDVSLIKINSINNLHPIKLTSDLDSAKIGQEIVLIAYPGSSPPNIQPQKSYSPFSNPSTFTSVPSVSIFKGTLSKVYSDKTVIQNIYSSDKEFYQLDFNHPGAGSSGGPIFNENGNVIAICFAEYNSLTLAIPIKFGIALIKQY